ncbi:hypothetical protein HUB98_09195 [Paenibacillus barcinonensis]|uniref:Uncharacterized protein n=1 Tax=Paenibacillus barcinonensis TaxID=198119 RepID=A0A2V4W587_PAEBA|nr:hypothetical protein [Paenibacillus barcinonensis]PYE49826.1 hypothetical protein DFQ00_105330 [Paenibacillus barcinonensis]QKS56499.1 hypothetical protein HUB98_09195 [Paenibacillus barcinonensis]
MANDMVKFSAEVAKGISVGTKDVTIKLLIPLAAVEAKLSSLAKLQEKEVMVYLGDPQASFNFEDQNQQRDPMYNTWDSGRRVTTDSSGVVTKIEGQGDEQKDENQAELFDSEGNPQEPEGDGAEQDGDASQVPPEGEGERISEEGAGEPPTDDLPDWMKEGGDESGSKEMDFTSEGDEGDQQLPEDSQQVVQTEPPAGDKEVVKTEIDKEQLEKFILSQRPIFEDIKLADAPADFPALLQQRNEGKTWMEISKEINVPSGQISSKYGAYKKRVTKMMQDGVAV